MNKFKKYDSPEYYILVDIFKKMPQADLNLAHLIEEYIYDTVIEEDKYEKTLYRTKFGIKDGEYNQWYPNGQLWIHSYYKDGSLISN